MIAKWFFIVHSHSRPWPSCKTKDPKPCKHMKDKALTWFVGVKLHRRNLSRNKSQTSKLRHISTRPSKKEVDILLSERTSVDSLAYWKNCPLFFGLIGAITKLHRKNLGWCESNNWTLTCKFACHISIRSLKSEADILMRVRISENSSACPVLPLFSSRCRRQFHKLKARRSDDSR